MDVVDLPIASLIILPDARRLREAAIPELMESIREHGMLSPLCVRPRGDKWEIIYRRGTDRYRKARDRHGRVCPY